jgi:hypothetical protein
MHGKCRSNFRPQIICIFVAMGTGAVMCAGAAVTTRALTLDKGQWWVKGGERVAHLHRQAYACSFNKLHA